MTNVVCEQEEEEQDEDEEQEALVDDEDSLPPMQAAAGDNTAHSSGRSSTVQACLVPASISVGRVTFRPVLLLSCCFTQCISLIER